VEWFSKELLSQSLMLSPLKKIASGLSRRLDVAVSTIEMALSPTETALSPAEMALLSVADLEVSV